MLQSEHPEEAIATMEYLPASQGTQDTAPSEEKCPATQLMQDSSLIACSKVEYFPAGHFLQRLAPLMDE